MLRRCLAISLALLLSGAVAHAYLTLGGSANGTVTGNYVGINLDGLSYYSPEQPFLNVLNTAGSNNDYTAWGTVSSSGGDTGEEACEDLDSNGYVVSLTEVSGGSCTDQQYTQVDTGWDFGLGTPPGASAPYPGGSCSGSPLSGPGCYTLTWQGKCSLTFARDFTIPSQSTQSGVTISGNSVTSTNAWGTSQSIVVQSATPNQGGLLTITALPDSSNYCKAMSLVQTTYLSSYQNGELFSPSFKAVLAGFKRIRFMDWGYTNGQDVLINFSGALSSGATSGTIGDIVGLDSGSFSSPGTTWEEPSGTYQMLFSNGQVVTVTLTYGSSAVSWTPALTSSISQGEFPSARQFMASVAWTGCWSSDTCSTSRQLLSAFSWATYSGVPEEAKIQLCNELSTDCWINIPLTTNETDTNFATDLAELAYNGTGAVLSGSPLASFNGLNTSQVIYPELSNEVWNSGFVQSAVSETMGWNMNDQGSGNAGQTSAEWYGGQMGRVGAAFYSVYGATAFASRVTPLMATLNDLSGYWVALAMNAPDWVAQYGGEPPYESGHIGAVIQAMYMQDYGISSADATTLAESANQPDPFFAVAFTNSCGSTCTAGSCCSSLPANGWAGFLVGEASGFRSAIASQPWASVPLLAYEAGTQFTGALSLSGTPKTDYINMLTLADEDARFAEIYDDPSHALWPSADPGGFWAALAAQGFASGNQFVDVSPISVQGEFGLLQNTMQTISPLTDAPPKYQGIQNYIAGH